MDVYWFFRSDDRPATAMLRFLARYKEMVSLLLGFPGVHRHTEHHRQFPDRLDSYRTPPANCGLANWLGLVVRGRRQVECSGSMIAFPFSFLLLLVSVGLGIAYVRAGRFPDRRLRAAVQGGVLAATCALPLLTRGPGPGHFAWSQCRVPVFCGAFLATVPPFSSSRDSAGTNGLWDAGRMPLRGCVRCCCLSLLRPGSSSRSRPSRTFTGEI
jgi:hypothetical protein